MTLQVNFDVQPAVGQVWEWQSSYGSNSETFLLTDVKNYPKVRGILLHNNFYSRICVGQETEFSMYYVTMNWKCLS